MTSGEAACCTAAITGAGQRVADSFTDAQRALYGEEFAKFTASRNKAQSERLSADESADRIVEPVEEQPAPTRAPVGPDAEEILQLVAEKSDVELDELRRHYVGLD
jgi:hypothetical protein